MKTTFLLIAGLFLGLNAYSQLMNETQGTAAGTSITTGDFNTIYGDSSGYSLTSGSGHIFIGSGAGYNVTTSGNPSLWHDNPSLISTFPPSSGNIFIGQGAGYSTTTGLDNVFVGNHAGWSNTFGTDNVFIGNHSGWNNTNGFDNTFVGDDTGVKNTFGRDNTFIGQAAGRDNTTGSNNTYVGADAGVRSTTGYQNTAVGRDALYDNTTGRYNTAVGDSAGIDCGIGWGNTFIGHASGAATEHAVHNTFVGNNAGWDNNRLNNTDDANYNTYVGSEAGFTNRVGEYNVIMGYRADFQNSGFRSTGAAKTDNNYNVAIGANSLIGSSKNHTVQMGSNTAVSGNYATAIGDSARVTADYGTTLGARTSASGMYSTAIGTGATVAQNNAMVLGGATTTDRVSVGIGTATPNANASLDLGDTDKGFLVNRMTTALRTTLGGSLTASEQGLMVYDTDENAIYTWDGAAWQTASGGGTDSQDLTLVANTLALTNDPTTVDLSGYLDNTDAQNLYLSGNILDIDNGTGVDLSMYLDNTDTQLTEAQVDAYVANNGYLTTFTEVDGDVTNEIQDISLAGSNLSISSGSTIDLSSIDTDTQLDSAGIAALGFVAGPHTVDTQLSEAEVDAYVANNGYLTSFTEVDGDVTNEIQDLTGVLTEGNDGGAMQIKNIADPTDPQDAATKAYVDLLEATVQNMQTQIDNMQLQLTDHEDRITFLEGCACDSTAGLWDNGTGLNETPILYQNIPNPFNGTSSIKYYVPSYAGSANIVISNSLGQIVHTFDLNEVGNYGEIQFNADGLAHGKYFYTMYVNQTKFETKSMLIE